MHKFFKIALVAIVSTTAFGLLGAPAAIKAEGVVPQVAYMRISAFSSTPDQTDNTPFVTANGTLVHDGVVASNAFPFGTKIQIPALFGNKIFTVEDRMAKKFKNSIDIWMTTRSKALYFGVATTNVLVWLPGNAQVAEK